MFSLLSIPAPLTGTYAVLGQRWVLFPEHGWELKGVYVHGYRLERKQAATLPVRDYGACRRRGVM